MMVIDGNYSTLSNWLKDVIYQVLVIDNGILVNSPIITNNNGMVNHQQ